MPALLGTAILLFTFCGCNTGKEHAIDFFRMCDCCVGCRHRLFNVRRRRQPSLSRKQWMRWLTCCAGDCWNTSSSATVKPVHATASVKQPWTCLHSIENTCSLHGQWRWAAGWSFLLDCPTCMLYTRVELCYYCIHCKHAVSGRVGVGVVRVGGAAVILYRPQA